MSARCEHGVRFTDPGVVCVICTPDILELLGPGDRAKVFELIGERWCLRCGESHDVLCGCLSSDE